MKKCLTLLFFFAYIASISAQENTISGVLKDHSETLIGANILNYRNGTLIHGTITDIEGKYTIACEVGDSLVFSYTGFTTQSIFVTQEMLDRKVNNELYKINTIESKAFKKKMEERKASILQVYKENSEREIQVVKTKGNYLHPHTFIDFDISNGKLILEKPKKPIHYDLTISQKIGVQDVMSFHTHALQNEYSQGRPVGGVLMHRDHNSGEAFSFGPKINIMIHPETKAYNNSIFKPGLTWNTKVKFQAEQDNKKIYSFINYEKSPDIFDFYNNHYSKIKLGFIDFKRSWSNDNYFNIEFNAHRFRIGNHNLTGHYQNVLKSMMVQSPSFNAENGIDDNSGYSSQYDHPVWLLENNNNPIQSDHFNLTVNHATRFGFEDHKLHNSLLIDFKKMTAYENYTLEDQRISNQLNIQTPSTKLFSSVEFNLNEDIGLVYKIDNIATAAKANFKSQNNSVESFSQTQNLFRNNTTASLNLSKNDFNISLGLNTLLANNQNNEYLNPNFDLSKTFKLNHNHFDRLRPYISTQRVVKNFDLLLDRYNYSSLTINHYASQNLRLDLPLWLPNNLQNEIKTEYIAGLSAYTEYDKSAVNSHIEYKFIDQKNVIFPLLENNRWILQNAADYTLHSLSWMTKWSMYKKIFKKQFYFSSTFELNHFQTKVNKLHSTADRIPIAGFANVSKNLIVDYPLGVIVGSDFERNKNGDRIIGEDGFPMQSNQLHIIADPTPLFTFSFGQGIRISNFSIDVIVDGQIGGQVWNGTQQTLDYYGVSQNSAEKRTITDYVFGGVDLHGNINTIPVAFADPSNDLTENRWTRYGEEGIASDYIRNASYIRLNTIELTYQNKDQDENYISKISIYAKNIMTIAAFKGYSNAHLYEDSIARGLQYFNQPNATEVGISLTYKL